MQKFILVEIGCLECGIGSDIVGVFSDKEKAEELSNKLNKETGTDYCYEVYDMPEIDVINPAYKDRIK